MTTNHFEGEEHRDIFSYDESLRIKRTGIRETDERFDRRSDAKGEQLYRNYVAVADRLIGAELSLRKAVAPLASIVGHSKATVVNNVRKMLAMNPQDVNSRPIREYVMLHRGGSAEHENRLRSTP